MPSQEGSGGFAATRVYSQCRSFRFGIAMAAVFTMVTGVPTGFATDCWPPPPATANGCFTDVPPGFWADGQIEAIADAGIMTGCGEGFFCPGEAVTREEMAVFIGRAMHANPPSHPPTSGFLDVPDDYCMSCWIKQFSTDGFTAGCAAGPLFCPYEPVNREQMAVFLVKLVDGTGTTPPSCSGDFLDVPCPSTFADWIERLADLGISSGCGGGYFCPKNTVTYDQMAVFLGNALSLTPGTQCD